MGGPLGGTVNYYRPAVEAVLLPALRQEDGRWACAATSATSAPSAPPRIPYYHRYFLGGENQIRGYNIRTVSPINPTTTPPLGGNKYMLFNAEYYFDVFGPLRLLAFFDAGEAYPEGQGLYWKTMSTSTGAELRFLMPVLNVPFRLIYAWNPNRDSFQPATAFKFAVGTTF